MINKPRFIWKRIGDCDWKAEHEKYMLRVERMDKNIYWWCVYAGDETVDGSWYEEEAAATCVEAKRRARAAFYIWFNK